MERQARKSTKTLPKKQQEIKMAGKGDLFSSHICILLENKGSKASFCQIRFFSFPKVCLLGIWERREEMALCVFIVKSKKIIDLPLSF